MAEENPYFLRFCESRYRGCSKNMEFIETLLATRFDNVDNALALARDTEERAKTEAKTDLGRHLEMLNNSAKKMEKLESTFATKSEVAKEFKAVNKIMYIGVGIFIALEFIFKYLVK